MRKNFVEYGRRLEQMVAEIQSALKPASKS
jgi:hypothetical protein